MSADTPLVLVTGATGYLATHIVKQLLQAGYRVRGTTRDLRHTCKLEALYKLSVGAKHPLEVVQAELLNAESWLAAVEDCTYVIHTACPVVKKEPENEPEKNFIKPAIEGTLNVLQACKQNTKIKRVVLTSSTAAVGGWYNEYGSEKTFSEDDWPNLEKQSTYPKYKTLAEKAAWDFVSDLSGVEVFELSVVNPSYVMGPVLCGEDAQNMNIPRRLLNGWVPFIANLNLPLVDVRDVAAAHVQAMIIPEAAGQRHIIQCENIMLSEVAAIIKAEFGPQGYNVPTYVAPYWVIWLLSFFDGGASLVIKKIGQIMNMDTKRMRDTLGISPRNVRDTIIDMCYSMIENGMIKKTSQYRGRPSSNSEL